MPRAWSWTTWVLAVALACVTLLVLSAAPRPAVAHTLGLSSGEYRIVDAQVAVRVSLALVDGARLVPALDADGDRRVSAAEVQRARAEVGRALGGGIVVVGDGVPCAPSLTDAALTEGDGLLVELSYACGEVPRELEVRLPMLGELGAAHRHVARTVGESTTDVLLSAASPRVSFRAPAPRAAPPAPSASKARPPLAQASARGPVVRGLFLALGARAHLLLLLGLALLPWTWEARVGALSTFALGHGVASWLRARAGLDLAPQLVAALCGAAIAGLGLVAFRARGVEALAVRARAGWAFGLPAGLVFGLALTPALAGTAGGSGARPSEAIALALGVLLAHALLLFPAAWLVRYARSEGALSARVRGAMALALTAAGLGVALTGAP